MLEALALALLISTSTFSIDAALAQQSGSATSAERSFSVPAGSLASTLVAFGQQSGVQVSYVPSVAAGLSSPGVSGTMSADTALSRLLAGTGLSFQMGGSNPAVTSKPDANSAGAMVDGGIALDTIDVSGGSSGSAAADEPYQMPGSSAHISAGQIRQCSLLAPETSSTARRASLLRAKTPAAAST